MGQKQCFLCLKMLSLHPQLHRQLNMHSRPQTICPLPQVTWALLRGLGDQSPQNYTGVTAAHPKVEFPSVSCSDTVKGRQEPPALRLHPGCAVDFWMTAVSSSVLGPMSSG